MQSYISREDRIYAGFFARLAAYLLDAALVAAALLILRLIHWLMYLGGGTALWDQTVLFLFTPWDIFLYFLAKGYSVLLLWQRGATLGKQAMRLKVVSSEGESLTLVNALYRETIGKYLSEAVFYLGYLIMGADREKRTLHDILCDTRVVYDWLDKENPMLKAPGVKAGAARAADAKAAKYFAASYGWTGSAPETAAAPEPSAAELKTAAGNPERNLERSLEKQASEIRDLENQNLEDHNLEDHNLEDQNLEDQNLEDRISENQAPDMERDGMASKADGISSWEDGGKSQDPPKDAPPIEW